MMLQFGKLFVGTKVAAMNISIEKCGMDSTMIYFPFPCPIGRTCVFKASTIEKFHLCF